MQLSDNTRRTVFFLSAYAGAIALWWLYLFVTHAINTQSNYLFGFFFSFIPLFGGMFGLVNFHNWGSFSSVMGKSVLFISLGLITWGIGQVIFSFYNIFLDVEVPYPSLADVSFVLSWPLWGIGVYYLSRATGARFGLRSTGGKWLFLTIPVATIALSYYFLIVIARGGVLTDPDGFWGLFFDLAYPFGSVVLITLVALVYSLSIGFLGGKFRIAIYLILIGFVLNYIADFSFSYTTTIETFYSANWVDLLFSSAMFLLSLGVTLLDPRKQVVKNIE